MLISHNWLKKFIPHKEPAEKIVGLLIQAGIEVAHVRHPGRDISGVIVAELLSVEKHPQADRLSLTKVSTGSETLQVVCGAKNIAPGQKVPLAKVGAVLPGDFRIKEAKIRGVESFGMLCSAKELGFAEDAEGIYILPPDAPLGANLLDYLELPDTLFELEITPNRADLLSHWGVAREVGALLGKPARFPKTAKPKEGPKPITKVVKVTVEAGDLCPLYSCRVLENVRVGPSPRWLAQALQKIGQRPINNVVDTTNYVLHEMGQPLHAFDLDQLRGSRISVRKASAGEKIPLLNNTERELTGDMLVIADAERAVALAGIMGGANSQVTEKTSNILLEAAHFKPGSVRKTARQLGIATDSSYRFERGVDPKGVEAALQRAAALIQEVAGGVPAKGTLSVATEKFNPAHIRFRPSRANALLGLNLSAKDQIRILKGLGLKTKGKAASPLWKVECPSYRLDLTNEIDLIEEVARLNGYEQIPLVSPRVPADLTQVESGIPREQEIRFILHQAGFFEAVNSTFLPSNFPQKLKLDDGHPLRHFQRVTNPIADDQNVLRPSLLPSLIANLRLNLDHQQESVALYELNKVFIPTGGTPNERFQAAAVLSGTASASQWHAPERKRDFFDAKGLAEDLLDYCGLEGMVWEFGTGALPYFGAQSFVVRNPTGERVLWGGALSPKVLKEHDISVPCFSLEIELEALGRSVRKPAAFSRLPKFPSAWRDIALAVPDGVSSAEIREAIEAQGGPDLRQVRLFDLYRGPNVAPGSRSLAFRLLFQNEERTLNDQEVTDHVGKIVNHLKTRFSIALR